MTTTDKETRRDRRLFGVYLQIQRERDYEEANKEARRQRSRDYQRRRRAALKERSAAEQAAAREQAASYQAAYRERNRWDLLMAERRRRNTKNPDISKRKSRLHYPDQVDPIYREIHGLWNSNLNTARGKGDLEGGGSVEEGDRGGSVEEGSSGIEEGADDEKASVEGA